MNYEKYLPIGTVVMLKGGKKRAMITGFCGIAEENKGKTWDYMGCIYPEGDLSSNQKLLFDHSQIEKIYHIGLIDQEEKQFKEKLKEIVSKIANSVNTNSVNTNSINTNSVNTNSVNTNSINTNNQE